jgi:putative ABC transport system permease protein
VLARAHDFDPADTSAIGMWDTVEDMERTAEVFDAMTLFLGLIAAVTLSLGGIGVMNIMLVTVSERTSEIGLRKALGATKLRIMNDFLAEGCVLAFLSGLAGMAIAFGISGLLRLFPMPDVFPGLPVDGVTTAIAFGALTFTAVASALFPAWRAASLTPVEALRDER